MSKYKNITQFNLGVERVTENLSQGERLALYCLATNGDYRTAESHPGNGELMRVTGCKTRQGVNFIINKLIARKLIRKVSDGDGGRGLATTYRILIEDSRFPEPRQKPASNGKPASKPASSDNRNLQVARPKPASGLAENPQAATCTPPVLPPSNTHLHLQPEDSSARNRAAPW